MANVEFFNEDCLVTMKRLSDDGRMVDIVLTSPPYNTARNVKTQKAIDSHINRYDGYSDNMTNDEYIKWTINIFNEFDRILSKNGVILYNMSYGSENPDVMWLTIGDVIRNTNFMVADAIVWKKKSALPNNVSHNKLTRITEYVFVICRKDEFKTFNANKRVTKQSGTGQKYYENIFNFIEAPNNDGSCSLNKATYSSSLCEQLLNIYCKTDSVVYDPFMGTGTTAIACEMFNGFDNNITCIGSEISKAQVEYSIERLENLRKNK